MDRVLKIDKYKILCKESENCIELFNAIIKSDYKVIKALKDDKRSKVLVVEINGKQYVYKEPIEKNKRRWQQFINIFRGSESFRSYNSMNKLLKIGVNGPKPYIAIQKFPNFSCILMEYLDAKIATKPNYPKIVDALKTIHKNGFVHTDANIWNFLEKDSEIFLIDCEMKKTIFGKIEEYFDFVCLSEDIDNHKELYGNIQKEFAYKIAFSYKEFQRFLRRIRKKIRSFF